ncbi:hypothetical protein M501DRAFT_995472 [Patellaria atrata CBS 101060]|uniref:Small secreted protein n=1 Tax=Patellaria atrata CBS 101060 TaxID=1346257 RepID=A0A9P4VPP9_9PEZI|nr:hypothetical protein M501DRAFT_995472 [Patellaria atrata CBS 101060]
MRFSRSSLIAASAFILLLPVDARIANPLNLFRSKRGQPEQNHKRVESVVCVDHDIYSDFLKNISEANQFCVAHLRIPPATVETTYTPVM